MEEIYKGWFSISFCYEAFGKGEDQEPVEYGFEIRGSRQLFLNYHRHYDRGFETMSHEIGCEYDAGFDYCGSNNITDHFSSYELPPDRQLEVMNKWRDWYITQGFEAGDIVTGYYDDHRKMNDPEVIKYREMTKDVEKELGWKI